MNINELNSNYKKKMKASLNADYKLEWENQNLMDILMGNLPYYNTFSNEEVLRDEEAKLHELLNSYNFFNVDRQIFLKSAEDIINNIQDLETKNNLRRYWIGCSVSSLEETIRQQEFCLLNGEAGIGKSYFLYCLEEKLTQKNIPHLCIYGKFTQSFTNFNLQEIIDDYSDKFVFIVDAINELQTETQKDLLKIIGTLQKYPDIRIILSYRNFSMEDTVLEQYKAIAKSQTEFEGVSFESAMDMFIKANSPNILKYEDILYSNNPLFLKILKSSLTDVQKKIDRQSVNSITSITSILETYIKNTSKKLGSKKGTRQTNTIEYWKDFKRIAHEMYTEEKKYVSVSKIKDKLKYPDFLNLAKMSGVIGVSQFQEDSFIYFEIEYLADYLIARSLFDEIKTPTDRSDEKSKLLSILRFILSIKIIKYKTEKISAIKESVILLIFDSFPNNYSLIYNILQITGLLQDFDYATLRKIIFTRQQSKNFLKFFPKDFGTLDPSKLLIEFGGYVNQPFNCTHYLNRYYFSHTEKQLNELTNLFDRNDRYLYKVISRLKNILYILINYDTLNRFQTKEYASFAFWCCSSSNKTVKHLAMKLLYEIIQKSPIYKRFIIKLYFFVKDPYIKESIIWILSSCSKNEETIIRFFECIKRDDAPLSAISIKKISNYLGQDFKYIFWNRINLYNDTLTNEVSPVMESILFYVELDEKDWLPFTYSMQGYVDFHPQFLDIPKNDISKFNAYLEECYQCARTGYCKRTNDLEKYMNYKFNIEEKKKLLSKNCIINSLEILLKGIYELYGVEYDKFKVEYGEFSHSRYRKFFDISLGYLFGSIMCNYYMDRFKVFEQGDSIGFSVYNPLEYDEVLFLSSPIVIFNPIIEQLDQLTVEKVSFPDELNQQWLEDAELTRNNLSMLLSPIKYNGEDWVMLGGRIDIKSKGDMSLDWKDTYYIFACTSDEATITNDGNAKYLTIEHEYYDDSLDEYKNCKDKPFLCKIIRNVNESIDELSNSTLTLPPADIIKYFDLHPNFKDMSWVNSEAEAVIYCNNNKYYYANDSIVRSIYIKKKYLDIFINNNQYKYFVYAERFLKELGHGQNTCLHMEIKENTITKEIHTNDYSRQAATNFEKCKNCHVQINEYKIQEEEEISQAPFSIEEFLKFDYVDEDETE